MLVFSETGGKHNYQLKSLLSSQLKLVLNMTGLRYVYLALHQQDQFFPSGVDFLVSNVTHIGWEPHVYILGTKQQELTYNRVLPLITSDPSLTVPHASMRLTFGCPRTTTQSQRACPSHTKTDPIASTRTPRTGQ